jgi:hypothetical protein
MDDNYEKMREKILLMSDPNSGYDIEDIVVHLLDGEYFRDVEIFNEDYVASTYPGGKCK